MAGLKKKHLTSEILTELSWIMTAIDDIATHCGIETYHIALLKYRIQPEEETAIQKFLFFNFKNLNNMTIETIESGIAKNFFEDTHLKWSVSREVLTTLIRLWKAELNIH